MSILENKGYFINCFFQILVPVISDAYTISGLDYLNSTMSLCYITIESIKLIGRQIPFLKGSQFLVPFNVSYDSLGGKFNQCHVKQMSNKMLCTLESDSAPKKQKAEHFAESAKKKYKTAEASNFKDVSSTSKGKESLTCGKNICNKNKKSMQRPNYFVAVKVSNHEIHKSISEIQEHIVSQDNRFKDCMIPVPTLHITLMVMCIEDEDTHNRALVALNNIHQEYTDAMCKEPLKLEFKDIDNFRNKVIFAKIRENEAFRQLCNLSKRVHKHFADVNIFTTDRRREFHPHLTIAKMDFSKPRQRALRRIDPALYEAFADHYVGCETICGIQLLKMTGPKDSTGYYTGNELLFGVLDKPKKN